MGLLYVISWKPEAEYSNCAINTSKTVIILNKSKQKNDHMQFIFYKGTVCGPLRKNNIQIKNPSNNHIRSSGGAGTY